MSLLPPQIPAVTVILNLVFAVSAAAFITGSAIRCVNEGEDVRLAFLYNDPAASLMRCKCLNQEVVCRDPSLSKCTHGGKVYRAGETWNNGTCNKCSCSAGDVSCQVETCDPGLTCGSNARLVHRPGDCCPSCVEKDGECRLSDRKPFRLRTFDGHTSSFHGSCNYVMARHCVGKSFSVRVVHEIPGNESRSATSGVADRIMSVVVKVDDTKVRVSRTHGKWNIRVGRKPSVMPFIRLGVLSVLSSKSVLHIRTHLGLKVTWDESRQDLRISVPSKLKQKVCGLCGNYNSDAGDDLRTRKGRKVDDMNRFIDSWTVGRRGMCAASRSSSTPVTSSPASSGRSDACSLDWKKKVRAMTSCNKMKAISFTGCHRSISITSFYKKCVADVCSCSGTDCHCKAIASYINQCRSIGLAMSEAVANWKLLTSCHSPLNTSRSTGTQNAIRMQNSRSNTQSGVKKSRVCPAGSFFHPCTSLCKRTCTKGRGHVCRKGCRPGCQCPADLVWHESRCIRPSLCPGQPFRLKDMLH